jgi:hypothetical protein
MGQVRAETQYIIELTTNGEDISQFLTKFRIVNSIHNCWPIVDLTLKLDNQEIIDPIIYGQQPIKLIVWNTSESGEKQDPPTKFDLVYLESNLDLPEKPQNNMGENKEDDQRRPTLIRCIPYPAINVMSSFVNKVWESPTGLKPIQFIKKILDMRGYLGDAIIKDVGFNDYLIDQLVIPPMTIKRATDYIDEKFAIYKGPIFRYCNYAGKFLMWDLYEKMKLEKNSPRFKYIKFASQYDDPGLFDAQNKECVDNWGKVYGGNDMVETVHYPNSNILNYGYDNIMITHPRTDLYYLIRKNIKDSIAEKGIWHDKDETKYYSDLNSRKVYMSDSVGFEDEGYSADYCEAPVTSRVATKIRDMCNIRFVLKRNISLRRVMQVGEVCEVEITSEHEKLPETDYSGAYIIATTDITIDKEPSGDGGDNYMAQCVVTAFRSVQTKK